MLVDLEGLKDRVYGFDMETRSASHWADLPWPVAWFLGSRSRRFVEMGSQLKSMHDFARPIENLVQSVRWAFALKGVEFKKIWWKEKIPGSVVECSRELPPTIRAFTNGLRRVAATTIASAIRSSKGHHPWWRNMTAASSFAKSWIKKRNLKVVPTDKDGGFCLVGEKDLKVLIWGKAVALHVPRDPPRDDL